MAPGNSSMVRTATFLTVMMIWYQPDPPAEMLKSKNDPFAALTRACGRSGR